MPSATFLPISSLTGTTRRLVDLLAELQHDELGRFQWREPDKNVDYAVIDVRWVVVLLSHLTKNASSGFAPWKATGTELRHHEGPDVQPQAGPQRLIVGSNTAHWIP